MPVRGEWKTGRAQPKGWKLEIQVTELVTFQCFIYIKILFVYTYKLSLEPLLPKTVIRPNVLEFLLSSNIDIKQANAMMADHANAQTVLRRDPVSQFQPGR